jgi:uncharacterized spore protein YtfJ
MSRDKDREVPMNLKEVMQEISDSSGAKAVFGPAYVKDRVTFIPVAKVSVHACGCDRDAQTDAKGRAESAGRKKRGPCMGVSVKTVPLGYIEVRQGKARFLEIVDRGKIVQAGIILGGLALFLLSRLARRRRD